jgi:acyl-CoA reductase-like NAD-dependent aldehyde dehydrogenase
MVLKSSRPPAITDALSERMASFRSGMLGRAWPNIIAGRQDVSGRAFEVQCPFERSLVTSRLVAADGVAVRAAALAARKGQVVWAGLSRKQKADALSRSGAQLAERRLDLALALVFERGMARGEALLEADAAAGYLLAAAEKVVAVKEGSRPQGVVALLAYAGEPLRLLGAMMAAALAAGNAVVLRAPAQAGLATAIFMEALGEAQLPEGLVNMLGGEEAGVLLAECAGVDGFVYAGPLEAGLKLQRKAMGAGWPRPFLFWAKGRNCAHVTASADLDQAAQVILATAFAAAGSGIGNLSTVIADAAIGADLNLRLKKGLERLKPGLAVDAAVTLSNLADVAGLERFERLVKTLRQKGRVLAGGETGLGGLAVRPVIAGDLPSEHVLAREESFLPVLILETAPDLAAGLARAAALPRGSLACLFAKRASEAKIFRENALCPSLFLSPPLRPCPVSELFNPADFRLRLGIS